MKKEPIFIVGVGRSGTTLLAAMIGAHSKISCGPETHFFPRLSEIDQCKIFNNSIWPKPAARFLGTMLHSGVRVSSKYKIDEQETIKYLEHRKPSVPNLLTCFTEQYMKRLGKCRWAEKTPDHLRYVYQIRKYFPDSPILRIVRDPRDVALSWNRMPWGSKTFIEALLTWRKLDDLSKEFFSTDNLAYTLRYEDLVLEPEKELRKICNFIREQFEVNMIDTSVSSASVNSRDVAWKRMAGKPLNKSRVFAWKKDLPNSKILLSESILGDSMKAYGYSVNGTFSHFGKIYPDLEWSEKYPDEFESVTSQGIRYWKEDVKEKATAIVYIGNPANNLRDERTRLQRLARAFLIILSLAKGRLKGSRIYWIANRSACNSSGLIDKLLANVFRCLVLYRKD